MNITLTLGWWMIPALIMPFVFLVQGLNSVNKGSTLRTWGAFGWSGFCLMLSLLTRYL